MTEQEVFNKVWDHIIAQGEPSVNKDGHCLYRGPNGLKCAAGIFLTDEQAADSDEHAATWAHLDDMGYPELEGLPNHLIKNLQICHDEASPLGGEDFIKDFKYRARFVAKVFNLTIPKEGV